MTAAVVSIIALVVGGLALVRDATDFTITGVNLSAAIHLDAVPNDTVPMCTKLSGMAEEQADADLWVATSGGGDQYLLVKANQNHTTQTWEADVVIGGQEESGQKFRVFAFYLPRETSGLVASIRANGNKGEGAYYYLSALPPGVDVDPIATVTRGPESC